MPRTARQCADELEGIWDAADREGRELTPAERAHVEQLIESAKSQHSIEKGIREIGLQLGPGGGGQVVWPDGSGVRGGSPGERLAFSATDEPVKKIATSITISDELLSDAPAVQTFVNGQLSLFVQIEAERQLLRGTQGGNEVQGILTSRGVPVYAGGTAVGNKAVQLFIAMNGVRGSAFVNRNGLSAIRRTIRRSVCCATPPGNSSGVGLSSGRMALARTSRRPGSLAARSTASGTSRFTSPRSSAPARRWSAQGPPGRCGPGVACPWRRAIRTPATSHPTW